MSLVGRFSRNKSPATAQMSVHVGRRRGMAISLNPLILPGEDVVLMSVTLPALAPAPRRAAAAFAVEDRLAQPLEDVRVVLGSQLPAGSGQWLVAVVSEQRIARISAAEPDRAVLTDVMYLPVPPAGWAVQCTADRMLVRLADGSGFVMASGLAVDLWQAQGRPPITAYGADLPAAFGPVTTLPLPSSDGMPPDGFDLGAAAVRAQGRLPRGWKPILGLIIAGLTAHLGLVLLDGYATTRIVGDREAVLAQQLGAARAPEEDVLAAAARSLSARSPASAPAFLDLLTAAYGALPPAEAGVTLRTLRYRDSDGSLTLGLAAGDIAALQDVEAGLAAAGLAVTAGPATTRNGVAEAEIGLTSEAAP